jgi:septal ring factor EnvC (AmiA/AmiB activator)
MFLDELDSTFLFQLINLSVFIFFIWYVFKKYVVETIRKQIADKHRAMVDLQDKASALVKDIQVISQAIQHDVQICHDLKTRVVKWRARVEQIEKERDIEKQEQKQVLVEHARIQSIYLQGKNAYERILPLVIDQTHTKLEQKFEDDALAETFIAQLITFMHKGG